MRGSRFWSCNLHPLRCTSATALASQTLPALSREQDLLALHRVRAQLVKNRTALCNQLRGLLRERGVAVRAGVAGLKRGLSAALVDDSCELSGEMRELPREMSQWLRTLEQRIASCEARITHKFKHDERCQRLAEVPGVGPLTATALVAAVGNAPQFRNGRELSAYLGLVPGQHSSGGKTVLLGITKRGDRYLRTLLIHGARSALRQCKGDTRTEWAWRIGAARGLNVAAVAMANKNARVLWALLTRGDRYRAARKITSAVLRPGSPPTITRRPVNEVNATSDGVIKPSNQTSCGPVSRPSVQRAKREGGQRFGRGPNRQPPDGPPSKDSWKATGPCQHSRPEATRNANIRSSASPRVAPISLAHAESRKPL